VPAENDKQFLIDFGNRVKQLRNERKISQAQLAFEMGLHRSNVIRIEKGEIAATILTLNALAKVLDVPISSLFP
jgi:transcriptional regulator with XRE-family HTH domain